MTELGTFGAVIGFAIELEKGATAFYQALTDTGQAEAAPEAVLALARAHRKRQQLLEQVRRENVTEMILEPIHGFYREEWQAPAAVAPADAASLERHVARFALAAADKVSIPQVARQLRRLAAESAALEEQARMVT